VRDAACPLSTRGGGRAASKWRSSRSRCPAYCDATFTTRAPRPAAPGAQKDAFNHIDQSLKSVEPGSQGRRDGRGVGGGTTLVESIHAADTDAKGRAGWGVQNLRLRQHASARAQAPPSASSTPGHSRRTAEAGRQRELESQRRGAPVRRGPVPEGNPRLHLKAVGGKRSGLSDCRRVVHQQVDPRMLPCGKRDPRVGGWAKCVCTLRTQNAEAAGQAPVSFVANALMDFMLERSTSASRTSPFACDPPRLRKKHSFATLLCRANGEVPRFPARHPSPERSRAVRHGKLGSLCTQTCTVLVSSARFWFTQLGCKPGHAECNLTADLPSCAGHQSDPAHHLRATLCCTGRSSS